MLAVAVSTALLAGGVETTVSASEVSATLQPSATLPAGSSVFAEDFENTSVGASVRLTDYVSTSGASYSADAIWLDPAECNGVIVAYAQSDACSLAGNASASRNVRRLADVLGQLHAGVPGGTVAAPSNGSTPQTRANRALAAFSLTTDPPAGSVEFATDANLFTPTSSRFLTFGVDVAEVSCSPSWAPSQLSFFLVQGGVNIPLQAAPTVVCTDPDAGFFTSDSLGGWGGGGDYAAAMTVLAERPALVQADEGVGLVLRNGAGTASGNDHAIDNVRLMDVTPQLSLSFTPASVPVGSTSTLTITVRNTDELFVKHGWGFENTLPDGLVAAGPVTTGAGCTASASAAGRVITVMDGTLEAGAEMCELSVPVRLNEPTAVGEVPLSLTNAAGDFAVVEGLDLPAPATVEFYNDATLTISKSIVGAGTPGASATPQLGDTITYEVSATNEGSSDFTDLFPAVLIDDLTGVLDDGRYLHDANATRAGTLSYAAPMLRWEGPLASGATVTLTYSVRLTSGGDGVVSNIAWEPDDPANPVTPAHDDTGEPQAHSVVLLPSLTVSKSADRTDVSGAGERVTFFVEVTNDGPGDYTVGSPATMTDDLSEVFDEARLLPDTLAASGGRARVRGDDIAWSGPLAAGESVTVSYTVEYLGGGDHELVNTARVPHSQVQPESTAAATVQVPVAQLQSGKRSDTGGRPVPRGDTVSYELTFSNEGSALGFVDAVDDLSGVLDDARLLTAISVDAGLEVSQRSDTLVIEGTVHPGRTATITYTVRTETTEGDRFLVNQLLPRGGAPLDRLACAASPMCTVDVVEDSDTSGGRIDGRVPASTLPATGGGPVDVALWGGAFLAAAGLAVQRWSRRQRR